MMKRLWMRFWKSSCEGSLYVEALISIGLIAMVGATLMPMFPKLLQDTETMNRHSKLIKVAEYVGDYVFRWVNFHPQSKQRPFEFYTDGMQLELSEDRRINTLLWAEPLLSGPDALSNEYRVSIQFFETAKQDSAVLRIEVWYDTNLNNVLDSGEASFSYSTILTEKQKVL